MQITLERLPGNDLPLPTYKTSQAAGIDFAACLKRPCFIAESRTQFVNTPTGRRRLGKDEKWEPDDNLEYKIRIAPQETILIPLGFKSEFDPNYVLQIYIRSSMSLKGLFLANSTGIIDSDYRGELFSAICNRSSRFIDITHGDRIVQAILINYEQAIIQEASVSETDRGEGGFGSTGRGK